MYKLVDVRYNLLLMKKKKEKSKVMYNSNLGAGL